jgi:hypothetical protein
LQKVHFTTVSVSIKIHSESKAGWLGQCAHFTANILIQPLAKTRQAGWLNVHDLTANILAVATSQNKGWANVLALTANILAAATSQIKASGLGQCASSNCQYSCCSH